MKYLQNKYTIAKLIICILILCGISLLVVGIVQENKTMMTSGIITIIAVSLIGMAYILSRKTQPITKPITMDNHIIV